MKVIKKVLVALLVIAVIFGLFFILHDYGTKQRGYEAIGGEIFVFFLPYLGYVAFDTWQECKEAKLIDDEEAEDDEQE